MIKYINDERYVCVLKKKNRDRMKGTVKFFDEQKNFGFIEPDEGEEDCFVHRSEIEEMTLNEGDRVEFEREEGEKGPQAVNVKKID